MADVAKFSAAAFEVSRVPPPVPYFCQAPFTMRTGGGGHALWCAIACEGHEGVFLSLALLGNWFYDEQRERTVWRASSAAVKVL